jgi:hypothetical protein
MFGVAVRGLGRIALLLTFIAASGMWSGQARAQAASTPDTQRCAALASLPLEGLAGGPTKISSAVIVETPAGLEPTRAPSGITAPVNTKAVTAYCQVKGYVGAQSYFELRLPLPAAWNNKFFFLPCAGFCGTLDATTCNFGLSRGYAALTSNGGHMGIPEATPQNSYDAVWAYDNPQIQEDFGYRSNHLVTVAAKKIVESYYGKKIVHSYASGCSKGGEAVLAEAQRYPEDYDGVIAAAPVLGYTDKIVVHAAWTVQANADKAGHQIFGEKELALVHKAVLAACDKLDGVEDGLITNPKACPWEPKSLQCRPGGDPAQCLTAEQVAALDKIYGLAVDSKGKVLFPTGFTKGSEEKWVGYIYTPERLKDFPPAYKSYYMAQQSLRYLTSPDGRADFKNDDPLKFNFDTGPARLERARSIYDSTSVDLRAFKARGGKVLMWHGWSDEGIPTGSSIAYFERAAAAFGGPDKARDFFRLFLLPGVYHCFGGPGPSQFDPVPALENWVEKGVAPEVLITSHVTNGAVDRTRPVYAYPLVPKYTGTGSTDEAQNFRPANP